MESPEERTEKDTGKKFEEMMAQNFSKFDGEYKSTGLRSSRNSKHEKLHHIKLLKGS